ncbi:GLPGLI family protein [uncultured Polaribacter sp.]|uniref:GLPGLI family protein n=1 Tax=uncultured Polaribacter sp. TaxID=174711 RepID=UPI00262FE335|nr:GLPGLI family protein [uncultured Polaribacter sp.]
MRRYFSKLSIVILLITFSFSLTAQNFSGKAVYMSKTKMDLGSWGAKMSEARKKQVAERLKNRLEKTYILEFNKQAATFKEEEKIDAISGATDSWGSYFSRGYQYKNIADSKIVQAQEFYGKRFLIKDDLYKIDWTMGSETKQIGNYTCFRAKAFVPYKELNWYNFSWGDLRKPETKEGEEPEEKMVLVEAWYTPQIPLAHGPAEFWGLPGFILEVSAENTTLLCTEIAISKNDVLEIKAPDKGKEVTKVIYTETVQAKMLDMRNNRGRRRG